MAPRGEPLGTRKEALFIIDFLDFALDFLGFLILLLGFLPGFPRILLDFDSYKYRNIENNIS